MQKLPDFPPGYVLRKASDFQSLSSGIGELQRLMEHSQVGEGPNPFVWKVKNTTANTVAAGGILAVAEPEIAPNTNLHAFRHLTVLTGTLPAGDGAEKFVIALEAILAGSVGRCTMTGPVVAQINVVSEDHVYAAPAAGTTVASTATAGPIEIIYKYAGTGSQWSILMCNQVGTCVHFIAELVGVGDDSDFNDGVSDNAWDYKWTEKTVDEDGYVTDLDDPRHGGDSGTGALQAAREFLLTTGLYRGTGASVIVHVFEFRDETGGQHFRFALAGGNALLDGFKHNDTEAAAPIGGDMITAQSEKEDGSEGKWNSLPVGAGQSVLYVQNAVAADPEAEPPVVGQCAAVAWFPPGAAGSLFHLDVDGNLTWFPSGDSQDVLITDDTSPIGMPYWFGPGTGSIVGCWMVRGTDGKWTFTGSGSENQLLRLDENNMPVWFDGPAADGQLLTMYDDDYAWTTAPTTAGQMIYWSGTAWALTGTSGENWPLRMGYGGVPEWYEGPSDTIEVHQVRKNGLDLEYRARTLTVTKGLVTGAGTWGDWTVFDEGTECP
jgi:hypothetical protein